MRKIRQVGGFFPLDEEGYIDNPCGWEHIDRRWYPPLSLIVKTYRRQLGDQLHSVWLRGSLARGLAVEGIADVDSFALVHLPVFVHWQEAPWQGEEAREVLQRFPFAGEVEFVLNSFHEQLASCNRRLSMLIATQSMPLSGEDIRPLLPKCRPGPDMMLYCRRLASDMEIFRRKPTYTARDCRELTKAILRSSMEMTGAGTGQFTPDLYWCYRVFAGHFPSRAGAMRQMLHYYLNPVAGDERARSAILKLGRWLVAVQGNAPD